MLPFPHPLKRALKGAFWGVPFLFILGACSAVQEAAQEAIRQSAIQVDQDQIAVLLEMAAGQGLALGANLSQYSSTPAPGGSVGPTPLRAPRFQAQAVTSCVERTPAQGVNLFSGNKTLIEDYSACPDRQGQIKYESTVDEFGGFKIRVTLTGYSEGSSGATNYTYRNGESIWAFSPTPSGLILYIKNQIHLRFNHNTPSGLKLLDLQANDLWIYTLDFNRRELTINATSTLKDLASFRSFILDLQEVVFHDPHDPQASCPTNPLAGRASLSSEKESLTVEVIRCATGKVTDKDGTSKDIGQSELDKIFGKAAEKFLDLFTTLHESRVSETVHAGQGLKCAFDPQAASQIDPNLRPEIQGLLGHWCTAWPVPDPNGLPQFNQAGWLSCAAICLVAPQTFAYQLFVGIASKVMGPNPDPGIQQLFSTNPSENWVISDYTPVCREPVPVEMGAIHLITVNTQVADLIATPVSTPDEIFTVTPNPASSIPPFELTLLGGQPPTGLFLWWGSWDAAGNPDFSTKYIDNYYKKELQFPNLPECTVDHYNLIPGHTATNPTTP